MKSLFNRLTGKAVSRTAFVEHLGQEVIQHHPNWKVMISTDHKLMRIDIPLKQLLLIRLRRLLGLWCFAWATLRLAPYLFLVPWGE